MGNKAQLLSDTNLYFTHLVLTEQLITSNNGGNQPKSLIEKSIRASNFVTATQFAHDRFEFARDGWEIVWTQ